MGITAHTLYSPVTTARKEASVGDVSSRHTQLAIPDPLMAQYTLTTAKMDQRACLLCKRVGDDVPAECGRLLNVGIDQWVHVNCAIWSAEVEERIDGGEPSSLYTVVRVG